jgi:CheY-like chemotaxis protein
MSSMKKHICLAEDDPDDYYFFSRTLEEIDKSIKLTWFTTGEKLLQFLKVGIELPDIIVLDMNMPKMDGQACLISIKSEAYLHHIPVVILSTSDCPKTIQTAYEGGAFRYFVKPHTLDEFRKIIQEILAVEN